MCWSDLRALASKNERSSCRRAAERRAERREPACPRELEQNGAPPTTMNLSVTGIAVCMGRMGEAYAGLRGQPTERLVCALLAGAVLNVTRRRVF